MPVVSAGSRLLSLPVPFAPQRILIVLLGAIGDVTRALPLLTRLRHAYPTAHIAWAVEPATAALLDYHPALNEVLLYQRVAVPYHAIFYSPAVFSLFFFFSSVLHLCLPSLSISLHPCPQSLLGSEQVASGTRLVYPTSLIAHRS
jgi:hypothetical protein